ncbi:MAG TPA: hypothetical protein VFZ73_10465 [Gemmatimonadaceae bacterium]
MSSRQWNQQTWYAPPGFTPTTLALDWPRSFPGAIGSVAFGKRWAEAMKSTKRNEVSRTSRERIMFYTGLSLVYCLALAQPSAQAKRSCDEIEAFMRSAKVQVLNPPMAVMDDENMQHRVFVHTSDDSNAPLAVRHAKYRDTWKANVAAYELARLLEINIMPPYVEGTVEGKPASLSWGLDDVIMDGVQLQQRNVQPPDLEAWNKQMYVVRVFDELIYGGRAPSDLLITKDWQVWIIGPSQGFRPSKTIQNPENLVKCDRKLLAKMRSLGKDVLISKLGNWLTGEEIEALHARAGMIVAFFDREIAAKGEAAVLFDLDRSGVPCAL